MTTVHIRVSQSSAERRARAEHRRLCAEISALEKQADPQTELLRALRVCRVFIETEMRRRGWPDGRVAHTAS